MSAEQPEATPAHADVTSTEAPAVETAADAPADAGAEGAATEPVGNSVAATTEDDPQAAATTDAASAENVPAEATEPTPATDLPAEMSVLELQEYDGGDSMIAKKLPVPVPKSGEVLVRVAFSPVNPSDLSFLLGNYGVKKELPCVPGFEGSGVVVQSGGGLLAWRLKGAPVAFYTDAAHQTGTWAEYVVVRADRCIKLDASWDLEKCSMSVVNPITAQCFMEIIAAKRSKGAIHTAAASALGKVFLTMCATANVELINVVRRSEQVDQIVKLGAKPENCINTSQEGWEAKLAERAEAVGAHVAFDAVGGQLAGAVFRALPSRSTLYVYGSLDASGICDGFPVSDLIFSEKKIEGFWASAYLKHRNIISLLSMTGRVAAQVGRGSFPMEVQLHAPLSLAGRAVTTYKENMSKGKVLFVPGELKPEWQKQVDELQVD
eukprot:m.378735 g.378735  ORF g.378735 m.378735 type:complete len:436 (+) comp20027_c4_seq4:1268-2575(+)